MNYNWQSVVNTEDLKIRWCKLGSKYAVEAHDTLSDGTWSRFARGDFETEAEARAYIAGIQVARA